VNIVMDRKVFCSVAVTVGSKGGEGKGMVVKI
jgi:hypothetical protein